MTTYRPGDVVLLLYPFTSGERAKKRPALVLLDTGDDDVVVARITSQVTRSDFDVELAQWQREGLLAESAVRVHKLLTVEKELIKRRLGTLTPNDWAQVRAAIKRLWAL
jgi:mRNA interferase MazF